MAGVEPDLEGPEPEATLYESVFSFLDRLRGAGFAIGVDEYLEAQEILRALADEDGDVDPLRLRNWMAAVFCGRAEEQEEFYRLFDVWWEKAVPAKRRLRHASADGDAEAEALRAHGARVEEVIRQTGRTRWIVGTAGAIATIVGGFFLLDRYFHPPPPEIAIAASPDTTVYLGDRLTLTASASDVSGDRSQTISWYADEASVLASGPRLDVDSLEVGTHTITAAVDGAEERVSAEITIRVVVRDSAEIVGGGGGGGEREGDATSTSNPVVAPSQPEPAPDAIRTGAPRIVITPPLISRDSVTVVATVTRADGSPIEGAAVSVEGDLAELGVGWTDVTAVSVSSLGGPITGHADGTVRWWTGDGNVEEVRSPPGQRTWSVIGLQGLPEGGAIAVLQGPRGIALWQTESEGEPVIPNPDDVSAAQGVAFAPRAERVAVVRASGAIDLFLFLPDTSLQALGATPTTRAVFSPDGAKLLAYGFPPESSFASGSVAARIWDVAGDSIEARLGADARVTAAAWSADGRLIALANAGQREVVILDALALPADSAIQTITTDTVEVTVLAFVEESRLLAVGDAAGRLSFHRPDRRYASYIAHGAAVREIEPFGDGLVATRSDVGPARFWDVASLSEGESQAAAAAVTEAAVVRTDSLGRAELSVPVEQFERGLADIVVAHPAQGAVPLRLELASLDSLGGPRASGGALTVVARMEALAPAWLRFLPEHAALFVFVIPVVLALAWILWRRSNRRLVAERRSDSARHLETGLGLERPDVELYRGSEFVRARIDARRYRQGGRGDLDAEATIDTAVRRTGPFEPVFRQRLELPAYLALVDRGSVRDEAAALVDEFLDRLAEGGVPVVRYYYDGDPRMCAPSQRCARYRSLRELGSRYGGLRLLLFGDGSGLLNPVSGRLATWTERLSAWDEKALMTPVAVEEWSSAEAEVARSGLEVFPATPAGLRLFVDKLRGLGDKEVEGGGWRPGYPHALSARPARWLDRNPPGEEEQEELDEQLRAYLGRDGYRWLCSLAIYPELSWYLTLQLGLGLRDEADAPVLTESRLLRLTRLPWLKHGRMPDWLRERLVQGLTAQDEDLIRNGLAELLEYAAVGGDEAGQLHLARPKKDRAKRGRRRLVTDVLRTEPEDSPLHDYVFVSFLGNRQPGRLQVRAPKGWHDFVYERGLRALGLRPAVALGGVAVIAGAAALGVRGVTSRVEASEGSGSVVVEGWEPAAPTPPPLAGDDNPRIFIEGGTFMMGEDTDAARPVHQVTVSSFWIQEHEVTNEEYRRFVPGHRFPSGQERYPVVNVTWQQTMDYAASLGGSLPTEAQWEFAARGAAGRTYPWGNEAPTCDRAHYLECPGGGIGGGTTPVMSKPDGATPEGVHDLAGNAWEWVRDWRGPYDAAAAVDPTGPDSGSVRVLRGGSFDNSPGNLRGSNRNNYGSGDAGGFNGFRVAWPSAGGVDVAAPAPPTATLTAQPTTVEQGGSTTLRWSTTDATSVRLDGASVQAGGSRTVSPTTNATYRLVVTGPGGTLEREVAVAVTPRPVSVIPPGDPLNTPIFIEGGTFQMGSGYEDERPVHQVTVSSFWIQEHEVTNEEYRRFVPGHQFPSGQERYPVVPVTWQQAMDYAASRGGSLPTEAQWEFAARGTEGRTYPWGEAEPTCQRAQYADCDGDAIPIPVMSRSAGATPEGVHDLAGNVTEWVRDWRGAYPSGAVTDPTGPAAGSERVWRGGSFYSFPYFLRGATRASQSDPAPRGRNGFRVAWSAAGGVDVAAPAPPTALPTATLPGVALGQDVECLQRYVNLSQGGALGYKERTDRVGRCEGTFRPEVDDPVLWVAGFHESFEDFDPDGVPLLTVSWRSPDTASVHVTVHSVRRTQPYRMDTQLADQSGFEWPTDVLRALSLRQVDLAPMAYLFDRAALYLPLRIGSSDTDAPSGHYTLTAVPTTQLSDVQISVARVGSVGDLPTAPGDYLTFRESVGERIYIVRQAIRIGVDVPAEEGTYLAEVTGIRSGGQSLPPLPVWFYHPGS